MKCHMASNFIDPLPSIVWLLQFLIKIITAHTKEICTELGNKNRLAERDPPIGRPFGS